MNLHRVTLALLALLTLVFPAHARAQTSTASRVEHAAVSLTTNNAAVNRAFHIAMGDLLGNVKLYQGGILTEPRPCILAGLDYNTPWTRDASMNAWNGASLIVPEAARDTLLSVLGRPDGQLRIGGQYWDCIVWASGAWQHYLYTGDADFLAKAYEATRNTLAYFESQEFNPRTGLFRGPGWSDGVAAYHDAYATPTGAILDWPKYYPTHISTPGYGIPMEALSTNCLYYGGYLRVQDMARALGRTPDPAWAAKAEALESAINKHLWLPVKGRYGFYVSPVGDCDYEEALGQAYAILFGVADRRQAEQILENSHVAPAGVPCVWPTFARYENAEGTSYGRHSGVVWPQIQGMWADAAYMHGNIDMFAHEMLRLAEHASRDRHFAEIFHPDTGKIYGGMQEAGNGIRLWQATSRQTWAATALIRMVLLNLAGLRFEEGGVRIAPALPPEINMVDLKNVAYRDARLDLHIEGQGTRISRLTINSAVGGDAFIPANARGDYRIDLRLEPEACHRPVFDADGDTDVDHDDFAHFKVCYTAGNGASDTCGCFDSNGDRRVDAADLNAFAACFSGPDRPAEAACDD